MLGDESLGGPSSFCEFSVEIQAIAIGMYGQKDNGTISIFHTGWHIGLVILTRSYTVISINNVILNPPH